MSGYFAIPRDLYASIQLEHLYNGYGYTIAILNEIAYRVRWNGNYKDNIKIGQSLIGRKELAKVFGISEKRVRTALACLERVGAIGLEGGHKGTIVTILDKRIYSASGANEGPMKGQEWATNIPIHTTTTKEEEFKTLKQVDVERLSLAYNASMPEMMVEIRSMEEWLADPKKNKKKMSMSFRFASNWMKRWESRPKPNAEIEAIKREMFKPHPTQKNWE